MFIIIGVHYLGTNYFAVKMTLLVFGAVVYISNIVGSSGSCLLYMGCSKFENPRNDSVLGTLARISWWSDPFCFLLQRDNQYHPYPLFQVRHIAYQLIKAVKCKLACWHGVSVTPCVGGRRCQPAATAGYLEDRHAIVSSCTQYPIC